MTSARLIRLAILTTMPFTLIPASSIASTPQDMTDALKRKYDILEQRAKADQVRAEAEASSARAANSRATPRNAPSQVYEVPTGDPLEGADVQACEQPSGATLKVSGRFKPAAGTKPCSYK